MLILRDNKKCKVNTNQKKKFCYCTIKNCTALLVQLLYRKFYIKIWMTMIMMSTKYFQRKLYIICWRLKMLVSLAFFSLNCNCVSNNVREMMLPPSFTCIKYNDKENDKKFMRILRNNVKNYTFFLVLRMFTLSCLFFRRIHVGKPVQVENYVCNTKIKCNYQFFIFLVCILWIFGRFVLV